MSSPSESLGFALKLYKQLSTTNKNLVFSPFSLSTCLSMVLMGSRNTCAEELSNSLFGKTIKDTEYESTAKELKQLIEECIKSNEQTLRSANFVYNHSKFAVLPQFQQLIQNYFFANSKELDFFNKKKESVDVINGDIRSATNGKIDKLLEDIDNQTVLVLANALYFKGLWSSKFTKENTISDKFTTSGGQQKDVQMMFQSSKFAFTYSQHLKARAIELSYENSNAVMIVVLPDEDIPLKQLMDNLSTESLNQLVGSLRPVKVDLYLPKFKLQSTLELIPTLIQMGIKGIFSKESADLSGLSRETGLYVSQVIQKAVIEVNEEGTEAAAATAVGITLMSLQFNQVFKANHPFAYFLVTKSQQKAINSVLFMGECNDPNL